MLTRIKVHGPASFDSEATLETSKKVNLIYGLNGSGKSTICRYLASDGDPQFARCSREIAPDCEVIVFNDDFVRANFYEAEDIPGIFSLSKQNKEAGELLDDLAGKRSALCEKHDEATRLIRAKQDALSETHDRIIDLIFNIKRTYSGGDRILEFCLEGLIGSKERLASHILQVPKPDKEPALSIKALQEEVRLLQQSKGKPPQTLLPLVSIDFSVEENPLWGTSVVGATNSTFAEFINAIKNSDWVKEGAEKYVKGNTEATQACPFCQEMTITNDFLGRISAYFDAAYEKQISALRELKDRYVASISQLPSLRSLEDSIFYHDQIGSLHSQLLESLGANANDLKRKIENPSVKIAPRSTKRIAEDLNAALQDCNDKISDHNAKTQNVAAEQVKLKGKFWSLMRWHYDSTVSLLQNTALEKKQALLSENQIESDFSTALKELDKNIADVRKSVVNTDEAVEKINTELLSMGISDFSIKKHERTEHKYELIRKNANRDSFRSLSEGEKLVISLLYFCELSTGTHQPHIPARKKIVVLDDPISSLSHIYVFNVGRLLWAHYFRNPKIAQVFVFTHSLYFFYELVDSNKDQRKSSQELFRVSKSSDGSRIQPMHYEELQNDYQSYWTIVNNKAAESALLANCMRNIIEYFFGFVEKASFANVFQKPVLQQAHFQAFNRYMNRESHSFGQNVFDLKEFDYDVFRDGLRLVFEETGYSIHYRKMSGL